MKKLFKKILKRAREDKIKYALVDLKYFSEKLGYSFPSILFESYKESLQQGNQPLSCIFYNEKQKNIINVFSNQIDLESIIKETKELEAKGKAGIKINCINKE